MTTAFKRFLCLLLFLLLALVVLPDLLPGPLEFAFHLTLGWIPYLYHVLPQAHVNWPTAATALACLVGFLLLTHTLARWLRRETAPAFTPSPGTPEDASRIADGPPADRREASSPSSILHPPSSSSSPWPLRWTLTAATVVLLMFTAGLATTGLTHQAAWLARMDTPIFRYEGRTRETAYRIRCMTNLREIGQALALHAKDHGGRYPAHLDDLIASVDLTGYVFVCPAGDSEHSWSDATTRQVATRLREGHATYVYLTPNLPHPTPARIPVVCEPLSNHDLTGLNILFSDGSVEWHTPTEAQQILKPHP